MKGNIVKDILLQYEKKRAKAEDDFERRKKKIYTSYPNIEKIDDQIDLIGLRMMRLVLSDSPTKNAQIEKFKDDIVSLQEKKDFFLKSNNIDPADLEIQYECSLCNDTGYLKNGEKCNCFKQAMINEYYKMSNISKNFERQNFNTLDLNLFSDEKIPGTNKSSKEEILEICSICEMFVQNFKNEDKYENLLFYGETGLGKTFMSNCIAKALLDKGNTVVYQTAFKMFDIIEEYKFHREDSPLSKENYNHLFDCDLLIIDDLGTELTNSFTVSELFMILNTRILSRKKTIISTNLDLMTLGEIYTERISSRIFESFNLIKFVGNDLRWENNFEDDDDED